MEIYLQGKKINLKPRQAIGKGGEADVFKLNSTTAVKVFKSPHHPDYQGQLAEQQAARDRLALQQQKLPQFPPQLPMGVITPQELVRDRGGQIIGYTMALIGQSEPLLRFSNRTFRQQQQLDNRAMTEILVTLHGVITQLHRQGIIIGDFNDLNVLIHRLQPYLIDADSFQFGQFMTNVFTARFIDPLLCDPMAGEPMPVRPYNTDGDWYSFNVMVMQCLLFVHPFGGVHKPKNPGDKIPQGARPLKGVTVFDPEVKYPKPAIPYATLNDNLLHHFHHVFLKQRRGQFPLHLLTDITWDYCPQCGWEYSNLGGCPTCGQGLTFIPQLHQGQVQVTQVTKVAGVILQVAYHGDRLCWLSYDRGQFYREDQACIFTGQIQGGPNYQFALHPHYTVIATPDQSINLYHQGQPSVYNPPKLAIDRLVRCNRHGRYWLYNGQLLRDGPMGTEYVGAIMPDQTHFWVGAEFGFGYYRAGPITGAFVFNAQGQGLKEGISFPPIAGQIIAHHCVLSDRYGWLYLQEQRQGKIYHRCIVIDHQGQLIALEEIPEGEEHWLKEGKGWSAVGNLLFVPSDRGILKVEIKGNKLILSQEFVTTEPWVNQDNQLLVAKDGIYVVKGNEIILLQLKP